MIKFFYDSLDTLQKVTFPTKNDYVRLTIGIFVTVIVAGFFFVVVDSLVSGGYKAFYTMMRPDGQYELEQQRMLDAATQQASGAVASGTLASGMVVDAKVVSGEKK